MTIEQLEPLTYQDRVRRMIELGRQSLTDAQANDILDALEKGDFSERILALHSCYGSYDGARALRAFGDISQGIRSLAMQLLVLVASDTQT